MTKKIFENYFKQNLKEQEYLDPDFGNEYFVKSGDTLYKIAKMFGLSVDQIMDENPQIKNKNIIHVNQMINLPSRFRPAVDKKKTQDSRSVDLEREDKSLIKINGAKVLRKAKALCGYSKYQAMARKAGWKLTCQWGGDGTGNTWAFVYVKKKLKRADIFISRQAFLGAGEGLDRLQRALFKITQIIEAPEVEGKRRWLSDSELNVFKDFIEDFAAAWIATTVAHELEHAKHSIDGEYSKIGKAESEVRAREVEAQMAVRLNNYVLNLIGDLQRLLENVYGFTTEELNLTVKLLPALWDWFLQLTANFFEESEHVHHARSETPYHTLKQKSGDGSWVDRERKEREREEAERYSKLMKKYLPRRKSQKQTKLASSSLNFLSNFQREEKTKVNKILKEYILKNTSEKFEETPFGQIVADEVNYVVNNLPEIQLAREVLGEQEAVNAGRDIALKMMEKLQAEMRDMIPKLVKQEVERMQAELADETQKAVASIETEEPAV